MNNVCERCGEDISEGQDYVFMSDGNRYMHETCFASYLIEGIYEASAGLS